MSNFKITLKSNSLFGQLSCHLQNIWIHHSIIKWLKITYISIFKAPNLSYALNSVDDQEVRCLQDQVVMARVQMYRFHDSKKSRGSKWWALLSNVGDFQYLYLVTNLQMQGIFMALFHREPSGFTYCLNTCTLYMSYVGS